MRRADPGCDGPGCDACGRALGPSGRRVRLWDRRRAGDRVWEPGRFGTGVLAVLARATRRCMELLPGRRRRLPPAGALCGRGMGVVRRPDVEHPAGCCCAVPDVRGAGARRSPRHRRAGVPCVAAVHPGVTGRSGRAGPGFARAGGHRRPAGVGGRWRLRCRRLGRGRGCDHGRPRADRGPDAVGDVGAGTGSPGGSGDRARTDARDGTGDEERAAGPISGEVPSPPPWGALAGVVLIGALGGAAVLRSRGRRDPAGPGSS